VGLVVAVFLAGSADRFVLWVSDRLGHKQNYLLLICLSVWLSVV